MVKLNEPLFITGPTASGKTTVGRILARKLGLPFIDADDYIVARSGMPVAKLFARYGPPGFRRREQQAVAELAGLGAVVVALGGGALLDPATRELVSRGGRAIVLTADADTLLDRLSTAPRPVYRAADPGTTDEDTRRGLLARIAACRGLGPEIDTASATPEEAAAAAREALCALNVIDPGETASPPPPAWEVDLRTPGYRSRILGRPFALIDDLTAPDPDTVPAPLPDGAADGASRPQAGPRQGRRALVVAAALPWGLFGRRVMEILAAAGLEPGAPFLLPDGERAKSVRWLERLWRRWHDRRAERGDLVVAVGGGTVTDLAGLGAATYLRGLDWAALPTTLLAQVDASVGGKVAINLGRRKNLVGAFHQPSRVLVDPAALVSLSPAQVAAGLAEVVKCGLLEGGGLWTMLATRAADMRRGDVAALNDAVRHCIALKADVVSSDERETGRREVLNLGHTVGHALEAASGWGHGPAVSVGLVAACRLAAALRTDCPPAGGASEAAEAALVERVEDLLDTCGLPVRLPRALLEDVLRQMAWDKKTRGGRPRFVIPWEPGRVERGVTVEPSILRRVLEAMASA